MKKKIITILLIITCVMFMSPINTKALDVNSVNISSSHRVAVSPDFYKILDCISKNVEKSSQRIR